MKNVKITSEGTNHVAVDLGKFDELMDYTYIHPKLMKEVSGKLFTGELLKSTGAELSFTILPPHFQSPFFHRHQKHEEIYIFLKGTGQFQVDDTVFDITEGSVIRIAPQGSRIYRNNSENPLIFICIQVPAGTLESRYVEDGLRAKGDILWNK